MEKARRNPLGSVKLAIVDTSIYVELYRTGKFAEYLLGCKYVIRGSTVVLAELARGIRNKNERDFVEDLSSRLKLIAPVERDWLKSGELVRRLSQEHHYDIHKIREIHFDVLIALTARRIGGAVITENRKDFERINRYVDFELVVPTCSSAGYAFRPPQA